MPQRPYEQNSEYAKHEQPSRDYEQDYRGARCGLWEFVLHKDSFEGG
jgi:hypothetical protein